MSTVLKPPPKLYLYWYTQDSGAGFFTANTYPMDGMANYTHIKTIDLDWGNIEFDEKGHAVNALYKMAGEAQAKVDYYKARIGELLAIGHDGEGVHAPSAPHQPVPPRPAPVIDDDLEFDHGNAAPNSGFDDDIPF